MAVKLDRHNQLVNQVGENAIGAGSISPLKIKQRKVMIAPKWNVGHWSARMGKLLWQSGFTDLANHMENEFVRFLNPGGRIAFHDKIDIGQSGGRSAIPPQQ